MMFPTELKPATDECPEPHRWHARDLYASEEEVSHFLGALCVLLRPKRVLETGSYLGDTTVQMGHALDGYGHLDTLEINPARAERVRQRTEGLPVTVHQVNSLQWQGSDYDLLFSDSDVPIRPEEITRFAKPGAVWVLHDSWWPEVQQALGVLKAAGTIEHWIDFPTPRGLAMGRYPSKEE